MGIYLDNSMTTRPSERALSAMMPFLTDKWGATLSPHQKGQELYPHIEEALRHLYKLVGAPESDDIIFTSSGAEAVNHAFLSTYLEVTLPTGRNQFVTSSIEEAPTLMSISRLEKMGCVGKMVEGEITPEAIEKALTPRTAMVSLSWGNGLTGALHPVGEIATLCQERGVLLHLEASHVLGKAFYELEDIGANLISFGGDLFHAPKGTGGLYVKQGTPFSPFILGGLEQGGLRAGTVDVASLVALGEAAREALESRELLCTEGARLRDLLEKKVLEGYPEATVFGKEHRRLPHCTTLMFHGIANEALLYALNRNQVFASIGGGSFQQIGLILEGSGCNARLAHSAVSFSLSRETTIADIEKAAQAIVEAAQSLRKGSEWVLTN